VERLVALGDRVRVLARDPARARASLDPSVTIVSGDLTRPETLPPFFDGASHVVFTAGVRSGRPASQAVIKAIEYDGVVNTLAAAGRTGFSGRFLYMTASGANSPSFWSWALNVYKGNTLEWRRRAEKEIRRSALNYTVIRAGMLTNGRGGVRAVRVTQDDLPLSPRYRVGRDDVADAFVAALDHPRAARATFEIVWDKGPRQTDWSTLLDAVKPD
jgi:uncharacterized protein YbjT (DUF2867 family)